jgi:hypothetical protein
MVRPPRDRRAIKWRMMRIGPTRFHHSLTKTDNENGRVTNRRQADDSLAQDCSNLPMQ